MLSILGLEIAATAKTWVVVVSTNARIEVDSINDLMD
jgi:hypothetical protein